MVFRSIGVIPDGGLLENLDCSCVRQLRLQENPRFSIVLEISHRNLIGLLPEESSEDLIRWAHNCRESKCSPNRKLWGRGCACIAY